MAIIIGDIHGDIKKARAFLEYEPEKEHVALGDYVDSPKEDITLDEELACLDLLLASNAVLLWGNHDLIYTPEYPWRSMSNHSLTQTEVVRYADHSYYLRERFKENGDIFVRDVFTDRFLPHRARMKAAYSVDGWLCTHAGVSPDIAGIIPPEVLSAGSSEIVAWLNEEFQRELRVPRPLYSEGPQRYGYGPLFKVHLSRGGFDSFGGIFWFDMFGEMTDPSPLVGRQIFGHFPVQEPEIGEQWVNLNSIGDGIWIFDTEKDCLVNIGQNPPIIRLPEEMH